MIIVFILAWLLTGWIGTMCWQIIMIKMNGFGEFTIGDVKAAIPMSIIGPIVLVLVPLTVLLILGGRYIDWAMQDHRPVFKKSKP